MNTARRPEYPLPDRAEQGTERMEIRETLAYYGLDAEPEQIRALEKYRALLREWNRKMDLTSVSDEDTAERHFADSLSPLMIRGFFPGKGTFCDVGTGAGFPGMPLAVMCPEMTFTLIDAQEKRCGFLRCCCEEMKLQNVRVFHGRAEDAGRDPRFREQFDLTGARAVAPLNVLLEYLLPLTREGGTCLCWKGPGVADEMKDGAFASSVLGGGPLRTEELDLRGTKRVLCYAEKTAGTPPQYPRRNSVPSRRPLREKPGGSE